MAPAHALQGNPYAPSCLIETFPLRTLNVTQYTECDQGTRPMYTPSSIGKEEIDVTPGATRSPPCAIAARAGAVDSIRAQHAGHCTAMLEQRP